MIKRQSVEKLLEFIDNSPTPWHAVATIEAALIAAQFIRLDETVKWSLQAGRRF